MTGERADAPRRWAHRVHRHSSRALACWAAGEAQPDQAPGRCEAYRRRAPENTLLYRTVQNHWHELQSEISADPDGRYLPRFVTEEFEAFLRCGILAHGFLRVRCDDCGHDRLLGLSCKRRGFCGSCVGRRMCDTAAHLVDDVLPRAPVRQWVLSVPHRLRYQMAYDPALTGAVLKIFVRAVSWWLRRSARKMGAREKSGPGR